MQYLPLEIKRAAGAIANAHLNVRPICERSDAARENTFVQIHVGFRTRSSVRAVHVDGALAVVAALSSI